MARISQVLDHPVAVYSRPGVGSVFSIKVPTTHARVPPVRVRGQIANLRGLRVLCVDDEPDVLIGTKALIERWGGQVTAATSAEDVTEKEASWDVVIADYHMGGESGLTLLRRLAEDGGSFEPAWRIKLNGRGGEGFAIR